MMDAGAHPCQQHRRVGASLAMACGGFLQIPSEAIAVDLVAQRIRQGAKRGGGAVVGGPVLRGHLDLSMNGTYSLQECRHDRNV